MTRTSLSKKRPFRSNPPGDAVTFSDSVRDNPAYPFVTIAIPTFNRAALLEGCVAAALSQTYPHFEVLVSNNASTDHTRSVLSGFDGPRLRVINQETNIGMGPNWNACLASAKGDYIIFVSDDDRIEPWLLKRCARLIRQQPQLPTVITLSNIRMGALGRTKPARSSRFHSTGIWDGTDILTDYLTDQITVTMCSVMIRTALFRARGGIPLDLPHTGDVAAWAPLLFLGKCGLVNEACATFMHQHQSETDRLGVELLLQDGRKVADLISRTADIHVADPKRRMAIQIQARRCFARRGLIVLADYRGSGGVRSFLDLLWRFRHDLYNANAKAVLRLIAVVLFPQPLTAQLRQLRHNILEGLA
jgi:glycosyltransferase involved in cell wall biosynthesis